MDSELKNGKVKGDGSMSVLPYAFLTRAVRLWNKVQNAQAERDL